MDPFSTLPGLNRSEGRTWARWQHHVTLRMLAHAFLTEEALRTKSNSGWTLPQTRPETQFLLFTWTGV